jgi:hypothetical protein
MARSQAELVHKGVSYDVEVGTTRAEAVDCARAIAAQVARDALVRGLWKYVVGRGTPAGSAAQAGTAPRAVQPAERWRRSAALPVWVSRSSRLFPRHGGPSRGERSAAVTATDATSPVLV